MAKQRHLKNAPIVEAIIDFRAKLSSNFDVTGFAALKETLHVDYPKMEERREFAAGLELTGKQVQQIFEDKGLHGYLFRSDDDKNVAQFRRDGFTFSRLRPYTEWETVLAEAKRLWGLYSEKASPELIARIAVRYVNQITIPLPISDFADYLTAPPRVPEALPLEVSHFMTRVVVCDAATDIRANIMQALQPGTKPEYATIILDVDVYEQYEQSEGGFEEGKIWQEFERLRELKNRIFFDSISEKTARLFE
jgi:uncharacterized protein (TIGR04255 family)